MSDDRASELHNALSELLDWAIDACIQGACGCKTIPPFAYDRDPSFWDEHGYAVDPAWHMFMSTWEEADEMIPRIRRVLEEA